MGADFAEQGGTVAVVSRMAGGSFGVTLMHEDRAAMVMLTLGVEQWRALLPQIEAACALAETPGDLPIRSRGAARPQAASATARPSQCEEASRPDGRRPQGNQK
jgi:hypothetical protein